jgi:hypothetical protein
MLVDRDPAAIVGDGEAVAGLQHQLDPAREARHRLVHRIVEHFGGKVMERALVRAADIHSRAPADGLRPSSTSMCEAS